MFVHMSQMIPEKGDTLATWRNHPNFKPVDPSMNVKKIFFSKNEKFIVLITENQAIVVEVETHAFSVVAQIDLPSVSYPEN